MATILTAALLAPLGPLAAQTFSGAGPGATAPFVLLAGERTVTITAASPDSFTAYLLSGHGSVVATLSADERQQIRVPSDGRYLFDVRATEGWTIRVEEPDPVQLQRARGRIDGADAARGAPASAAWLGKGLLGGLLLGPIGTAIAVDRAGRSEPGLSPDARAALNDNEPAYAEAFRQAYVDRVRGSERASALVGGITGTAILTFAILQLTVWGDDPQATGERPGTGENAVRVPLIRVPLAP